MTTHKRAQPTMELMVKVQPLTENFRNKLHLQKSGTYKYKVVNKVEFSASNLCDMNEFYDHEEASECML